MARTAQGQEPLSRRRLLRSAYRQPHEPASRPELSAIGNLTSQLLALNYLDELDHLINGEWGVKHYGRCGSADGWGKIGAVDGGIFDAGNLGAYWAAAPWKSSISSGTETYGGAHFCFSVGQYQVSSDGVANTMSRDFGLSVRCVRISQ